MVIHVGREIKVLVHANDSRENRPPLQIKDLGIFGYRYFCRLPNLDDFRATYHYSLILQGRTAGTVNHRDMRQRDSSRRDGDILHDPV